MLPWVQQLSHIPAKWAAIGDYVLPHKNTRVWQWVIYCRTAVCKHREQASRLRGVSGQLTKDNTHMTPPSALPHPSFSDSMPSKPVRVSWNPSKHTPTLQWRHSTTLSLALSLSLSSHCLLFPSQGECLPFCWCGGALRMTIPPSTYWQCLSDHGRSKHVP